MKDFMLIFHGQDYSTFGFSAEQYQARMLKWMEWSAKLEQENRYAGGHALTEKGSFVRNSNTVTDGPFAESKELVGGYFIIKAKDIEEASEISKGFPDFDLGSYVQVREVMVFDE